MASSRTPPLSFALVVLILSTVPNLSFAQATISSGSIVGMVSDPSGAVINGAVLTITDFATGHAMEIATNSAGSFSSGPVVPGNYKVLIHAKGFASAETTVVVQVGNTAAVNVSLKVGDEKEVIEVEDSALPPIMRLSSLVNSINRRETTSIGRRTRLQWAFAVVKSTSKPRWLTWLLRLG